MGWGLGHETNSGGYKATHAQFAAKLGGNLETFHKRLNAGWGIQNEINSFS